MAAVAALGSTGAGLIYSSSGPAHRERRLHLNLSLSKRGDTRHQPRDNSLTIEPTHGPTHEKRRLLTTTVRTPRTAFENDGEQFPMRPLATSMDDSDKVIYTILCITCATGLYVTYKVTKFGIGLVSELVSELVSVLVSEKALLKKLESNIIARVEAAGNKITQKWDDGGNVYYGQKEGGKRNGYGTYTWASGKTYVGEWKNGTMHGQGISTSPFAVGVSKYVGEWVNGNKDGYGTYAFADGSTYVGEWKNDKQNGNGTFTWTNGDKYVGEWKNDKMHGQGTLTWPDGKKYVGRWVNDKQNGNGTFTWTNGDKYVGEWKNGDKHGQGTYIKANGTIQDDRQAETKTGAPSATEAVTDPFSADYKYSEAEQAEKESAEKIKNSCVILFGMVDGVVVSPVGWIETIKIEMDVYDFTGVHPDLLDDTSGGDIFVAELNKNEGENLNNFIYMFLALWKRYGKTRESGQYVLDTKEVALIPYVLIQNKQYASGTEWRNLASLADIDNDGEITFVEFVRAYSLMSLADSEKKLFMDNP